MSKELVSTDKNFQSGIESVKNSERDNVWIPVSARLPEAGTNPYTHDYYEYPCTVQFFEGERDVRYYKFGRGHFYLGPQIMDHRVIAWMERPLPYVGEITKHE